MKYIIDSYAWIEYLNGSISGEKVNKILKEDNEFFSLNLTISEVVSRVKRGKGNVEIAYNSIRTISKVVDITPEVAKKAGEFHAEMITRDEHLKGMKDVVFIK